MTAQRIRYHAEGVVTVAARGPGPINAMVACDDGRMAIVPRGNLIREETRDENLRRIASGRERCLQSL